MKKQLALTLLATAALGIAAQAQAGDARTRTMAANCAYCHGPNGESRGAIPPINGRDKDYFIQQMKDFASGARPATVMHQHAGGYTDEEIVKLAEWFAAIK